MTTIKPIFSSEDQDLHVTKRDGEREVVSFDKILKRIKKTGAEADIRINYTTLAMKVIDQLYDGISTTKIDELTAEQCASMASIHPDYNALAGRIVVSNHQKNTSASFSDTMSQLYSYIDKHGRNSPLISRATYEMTQRHRDHFDTLCDYSRDYLIDYFGFKTLERAYLMKVNKVIVERPQHMWLRVAIGIHALTAEDGEIDTEPFDDTDCLLRISETYNLMSLKYFTHATPTLFNSGTPHPQLSSCYLIAMESDSIDGIYNTLKDCALISKWAGGIGLHVHNIRAQGSHINGTNGSSNGLAPMLRVFNNTAKYVDQGGGKRNGSFAIYLEPWHADVEVFLQMRKNHGDEELKARDLFYALWIPDLFMERVKADGPWTLMCPDECPGLADVYGDDFAKLYTQYEDAKRGRRTIKARALWFQILDAQMETGTPYILFKDAANKKSNQQNLGTIKSSNLCVAPETLVLTDRGHIPIKDLAPSDNRSGIVSVWNGYEFSQVEVVKTGVDRQLMHIFTDDGLDIQCTPYHKFWIVDEKTGAGNSRLVEAQYLLHGDRIRKCDLPVIDGPDSLPAYGSTPLPGKVPENIHLGNWSLSSKIEWFSAYCEMYGMIDVSLSRPIRLSVACINSPTLINIALFLQTCGIRSKINLYNEDSDDECYTMTIDHIHLDKLIDLGFAPRNYDLAGIRESVDYAKNECSSVEMGYIRVINILRTHRISDTYCFSEPLRRTGIFNGIMTSQCSEIIEYSDENETAVCNLASLALPAYVDLSDPAAPRYDYERLHYVTRVVTYNLNRIIDVNFYPTEKTRTSNMRHRPIGIGVQGLADVFMMMGFAFSSPEARDLNRRIFETIYHAGLVESCELAKQHGPYETFWKGDGCPAAHGKLQFDLWDKEPIQETDGQYRYDWAALKADIRAHGLRNSLLLAPMPTASTSQILGYNECIEPITSNIYSRRTIAGEFIMANKYLMNDLIQRDLWNEAVKNSIVANHGSIQQISVIPDDIREKYRTVWEIPMRDLIDMAADRGAYVCQSQSLNLWLEDPTYATLTSMHFYSWSKGLKTGIYYLRRRGKHQAQQFTIEPERGGQDEDDHEICDMCSS